MAGESTSWQAVVTANLQQARKTNGRLGSKKSRAGCVTCKIRRVKCDEARPACNRCKNTGRVCNGYSEISPRAKNSVESGLGGAISQISALGLKQNELHAFDYFLSLAAPRLSGGLDQDFWCGRMLQLCHSEPYVRDAALAISTLYRHPQYLQRFSVNLEGDEKLPRAEKIRSLQTGDPFGNYRIDENHAVALRYYNRAIGQFKKQMEAGTTTPLQAVLSCMLFMNIEIMRDSVIDALALFTQSVQLMRHTLNTAEDSDVLVQWLKQAFTRIGVLAATFGHPQAIDIPPEFLEAGESGEFPSLSVARTALFTLMAESHAFIKEASDYKDAAMASEEEQMVMLEKHMTKTGSMVWPTTLESGDRNAVSYGHLVDGETSHHSFLFSNAHVYTVSTKEPMNLNEHSTDRALPRSSQLQKKLDALLGRDRFHANQLKRWYNAFVPLASAKFDENPQAVCNLQLYYHVSLVWLSTRLSPDQTAFDSHTWHFKQILQHAEIYVQNVEAQNIQFTLEVGVVPQLYFTATKCRVPSLRRKALELLRRGPKKEAIWGAGSTEELAATSVWFEERGLGLPSPFEHFDLASWPAEWDVRLPPEENRIHNLQIMKNLIQLRFDAELTTHRRDGDGRHRKTVVEVPIGSQCVSKDIVEEEREVYHGPGGVGNEIRPRKQAPSSDVLSGHREVVASI